MHKMWPNTPRLSTKTITSAKTLKNVRIKKIQKKIQKCCVYVKEITILYSYTRAHACMFVYNIRI